MSDKEISELPLPEEQQQEILNMTWDTGEKPSTGIGWTLHRGYKKFQLDLPEKVIIHSITQWKGKLIIATNEGVYRVVTKRWYEFWRWFE